MEALCLGRRKKADIIITDIRMPGLNGLELCEKLHEANPNIQIILISGYADFSYAQRAIQLGVLGYCLKPVDIQYLQKLLRQARTEYPPGGLLTGRYPFGLYGGR